MTPGPADHVLAARAADGDDAAFAVLVTRHRPALVRAAAARLGPYRAEAEDVVQVALGRAHRALRQRGAPTDVRAWLHAIVRNRAHDVVRHHPGRHSVPLDRHDGATESADATLTRAAELQAAVSAISALPDRQREAIVDVVFAGLTYEQVAATRALSVSAVKALVNRARRNVRAAAAAVLPLPLLTRMRGLALSGAADAPAAGLVKGCAVVGTVATLSLSLGPAIPVSLQPQVAAGARARVVDAAQLRTIAGQDPATTRPMAAYDGAHPTPGQAIAACSAGLALPPLPEATRREALRRLPAHAQEYGSCADELAPAGSQP